MSCTAGTPTPKKVTQFATVAVQVERIRQARKALRRARIDDYVALISH